MSLYKKRIVITGGTGRFGFELKKIKNKYRLFFPLKKELNIPSHNILGHSDISPFRKNDPGEKFPWKSLKKKGILYFPQINKKNLKLGEFQSISKKNNITLYMLKKIFFTWMDLDPFILDQVLKSNFSLLPIT